MNADAPSVSGGGVVDAHVHVWDVERAAYPWLADESSLRPAYTLSEVGADMAAAGVETVVLVQAADNAEDTDHMIRTASDDELVAGIVAWVPIDDATAAAARLDRWSDAPLVGVRHLIHRDPNPDLLVAPEVGDVLDLLSERGLPFDVCAESAHLLGLVPEVAARHPRLTLVIDHLAKPPIRQECWEPWATLLADAASCPNVVAKLSGLNTAAGPEAGAQDYMPYVDHALEQFGPDRLMYGSDWPFALLAARDYAAVWRGLRPCLDQLDSSELAAVLRGTARRVYQLG